MKGSREELMKSMDPCIRLIAVLGVVLSVAACGGGGGNTLTEEEAAQAFASMEGALADVQIEAELAASQGGSGGVSVTATCSGGGSVSADGEWQSGESFSLDLGFDDCAVADIVINGGLSYAATGSSSSATLTVQGQLTFSGRVTGSCGVDLTFAITSTSLHVSGSICGIHVDENVST